MPTYIVANPELTPASEVQLEDQEQKHLVRVMRAAAGDEITVTNMRGALATVRIISTQPLRCEIISILPEIKPVPVTICLALIEHDRMEWAVEKLTEMNVARVQLVACARSQQQDLSASKLARLHHIARSALKQSGRAWALEILPPQSIQHLLKITTHQRFFGDLQGGSEWPKLNGNPAEIWIGPEGGWTKDEVALLQKTATGLSLGQTTLRSETAAVVLTARFL